MIALEDKPFWHVVLSPGNPSIVKPVQDHEIAEGYAERYRLAGFSDVVVVPLYRGTEAPANAVRALQCIAAMDPKGERADDLGRAASIARAALAAAAPSPIDMVLHCPACGLQHIDAPKVEAKVFMCHHFDPMTCSCDNSRWTNPPHRSHLCHGCGHIWRPADVPTNGVQAVKTKGKNDSAAPMPNGLTASETEAVPDAPSIPDLPNGAWQQVPCAVCFEVGHQQYGWLFIPHADGKWVSLMKLPNFSEQIIRHWINEPNARG